MRKQFELMIQDRDGKYTNKQTLLARKNHLRMNCIQNCLRTQHITQLIWKTARRFRTHQYMTERMSGKFGNSALTANKKDGIK